MISMENISSIRAISISESAQLKTITLKDFSTLNDFQLNSLPNFESITFENLPLLSSIGIKSSNLLNNIIFNNVPSIKVLDLSGCQLTKFPEYILTLKSLEQLIMSSNKFTSLPLTFAIDLPNLKMLDLTNNNLKGNIFQTPLIYLNQLNLNNNFLTSIDGIGQFQSLTEFNIETNLISSIPVEILKLSSTLKKISISNNKLECIPYEMTNMRVLTFFFAMNNSFPATERMYLNQLFRQTSMTFNFN